MLEVSFINIFMKQFLLTSKRQKKIFLDDNTNLFFITNNHLCFVLCYCLTTIP